ncbi:MAG: hypothetical protein ACM67R_06970 [Clostridiales bacterium]
MSNTTVRSNNNPNKTEVTGMEIIVFNPRENENENEYEIKAGTTLDEVLKDHIRTNGEMGIGVENGYVEKSGNSSKLVTANGTKTMKNPRAYEVISKQREQRRERKGKIKQVEMDR